MPALSDASVQPPAAAPAAPDDNDNSAVPDPLDDVAAGRMPAVTLPPIENRDITPQAEFVIQNFRDLGKFNLAYHEFPDQKLSVVYNPRLISEKQLAEAHAKKDLLTVAPLVTPPGTPPRPAGGAPAPAAAPEQSAPGPGAGSPPAAAAAPAAPLSAAKVPTSRRLQSARLQNQKSPGPDQPNSPLSQLEKRPV